jgi:acetyl esterase/lipase
MAAPMTASAPGRVGVENGVVFGHGGGRELRCDVFTPPAGTSNGVGVLLVHGGGWVEGDRSQLRGYGILLGRLGYTCVASEYRLSGEAKWPAQLHDVKTALRWMRANATTLGIDPRRIAVSGNSAGAHLALMLAATPAHPDLEGDGGHAGEATDVTACIAFYAPTDLGATHTAEESKRTVPGGALPTLSAAVAYLLGEDLSAGRVAKASPITYASADFPPTLLITGNRDEIVPAGESERMYRALTKAGATTELHIYAGAPHAFDAQAAFGRQCGAIMALFLERHVPQAADTLTPTLSHA